MLAFLAPFVLPVIGWLKGFGSTALKLLSDPKALLALAGIVVLALLWLQSSRLGHAKADLKTARAALVDPATHKKWQDEATASARDLAMCRGNTSTLQTALDRQSASLTALQAESARKTAEAEKAASEARSAAAVAEKLRARIAAPLKTSGTCAQVDEVFQRTRESLK